MPYLTPDAPAPGEHRFRTLRIPDTPEIMALVSGALSSLIFESNWQQFGNMTPEETAQMFKQMWLNYLRGAASVIGSIIYLATEDYPPNVLPCNGQVYNRVDYPELYAVLWTPFIIDEDQFFTPQLGGLVLIGEGESFITGTDYDRGDFGGEEEHTLTNAEIPAQSHTYNTTELSVPVVAPGEVPVAGIDLIPNVTGNTGGGNPHNNMQPFAVAYVGIVAR
jgi:microcystin-dependent protein